MRKKPVTLYKPEFFVNGAGSTGQSNLENTGGSIFRRAFAGQNGIQTVNFLFQKSNSLFDLVNGYICHFLPDLMDRRLLDRQLIRKRIDRHWFCPCYPL